VLVALHVAVFQSGVLKTSELLWWQRVHLFGQHLADVLTRPALLLAALMLLPPAVWYYCGRDPLARCLRLLGLAAIVAVVLSLCWAVDAYFTANPRPADAGPIWMPRYVAFMWPAMAVALAMLFMRLPTRTLRIVAISIFIGANLAQSWGRMFAGSEPPVDLIVADVWATQDPNGPARAYVAEGSQTAHPAGGTIENRPGKYYASIASGIKLMPQDFVNQPITRFMTVHRPASILSDVQRMPQLRRIIVWDRVRERPRDADPAGDDLLRTTWPRLAHGRTGVLSGTVPLELVLSLHGAPAGIRQTNAPAPASNGPDRNCAGRHLACEPGPSLKVDLMQDNLPVEQLESRLLPAASVINGILHVTATTGNDTVLFSRVADDVLVRINGQEKSFAAASFNRIVVKALGGNDLVRAVTALGVSMRVVAGAGNDTIIAADGQDTIKGGAGDDQIFGGAGNDVLDGGGGNDRISGEDGNDLILGHAGNDTLYGNKGDDTLYGGTGSDQLYGGAGNDRLFGEADNDTLFGGAGRDWLKGGAGNDNLNGGSDNDTLFGNDGNDVLDGGADDDILDGGLGNDTLTDLSGHDTLRGGDGNDTLDAQDGEDFDVLEQGAGTGTVRGDARDHIVV
jgi:hypothetical protein